ncbi:hypothetical protein GCM10007863_36670 [Dyella mobilis]|nr:hypothetical protein GCM10007863_36670 [Dyella mobilis]
MGQTNEARAIATITPPITFYPTVQKQLLRDIFFDVKWKVPRDDDHWLRDPLTNGSRLPRPLLTRVCLGSEAGLNRNQLVGVHCASALLT